MISIFESINIIAKTDNDHRKGQDNISDSFSHFRIKFLILRHDGLFTFVFQLLTWCVLIISTLTPHTYISGEDFTHQSNFITNILLSGPGNIKMPVLTFAKNMSMTNMECITLGKM